MHDVSAMDAKMMRAGGTFETLLGGDEANVVDEFPAKCVRCHIFSRREGRGRVHGHLILDAVHFLGNVWVIVRRGG